MLPGEWEVETPMGVEPAEVHKRRGGVMGRCFSAREAPVSSHCAANANTHRWISGKWRKSPLGLQMRASCRRFNNSLAWPHVLVPYRSFLAAKPSAFRILALPRCRLCVFRLPHNSTRRCSWTRRSTAPCFYSSTKGSSKR